MLLPSAALTLSPLPFHIKPFTRRGGRVDASVDLTLEIGYKQHPYHVLLILLASRGLGQEIWIITYTGSKELYQFRGYEDYILVEWPCRHTCWRSTTTSSRFFTTAQHPARSSRRATSSPTAWTTTSVRAATTSTAS